VQELQAELDGAMQVDGGEVEARASLYDRQVNAYGEARAAIKSALALGQGEWGRVGRREGGNGGEVPAGWAPDGLPPARAGASPRGRQPCTAPKHAFNECTSPLMPFPHTISRCGQRGAAGGAAGAGAGGAGAGAGAHGAGAICCCCCWVGGWLGGWSGCVGGVVARRWRVHVRVLGGAQWGAKGKGWFGR
jgi:hypothetical protein